MPPLIQWQEGQGQGSSKILQTGLERVVVRKVRPTCRSYRRPSYQSVHPARSLRFSPRCRSVHHNMPKCSRKE